MSQFKRPTPVDPDNLRVEPFHETQQATAFSSGNDELDDFIRTREVRDFENAGLGRTFLVFYAGSLVAYYTVNHDSLRTEYLRTGPSFPRPAENRVKAFPAVKIGRLAVSKEWQNCGIGREILSIIAAEALIEGRLSGVRLLTVEAKPEAVGFYQKFGFELTKSTRRERGKRNRTMFLDLRPFDKLRE